MDKPDKAVRVARPNCFVVEAVPVPLGERRRVTTMAQLEREALRRRWLVVSGAVVAALAVGVLIGRFLLP
jgi:hypothetical protein